MTGLMNGHYDNGVRPNSGLGHPQRDVEVETASDPTNMSPLTKLDLRNRVTN